jgi:hypothetical protein
MAYNKALILDSLQHFVAYTKCWGFKEESTQNYKLREKMQLFKALGARKQCQKFGSYVEKP